MLGKTELKRLARSAGLLNWASEVRTRARQLAPSLLLRNLRYRVQGAPDGLPIPPGHLIWLVIGSSDISAFLRSGEAHARTLIQGALQQCGVGIGDFETVLDFGCGCGRIIRHWSRFGLGRLCGTDYNSRLIDWCARNLSFAEFAVNGLRAPLDYPAGYFDFVYARSVFTHLSEPLQLEWFRELRRVIRPGGLLLFTVSGQAYSPWMRPHERAQLEAGELIVREAAEAGKNMCAVFHPVEWVRDTMVRNDMTILNFRPGRPVEFLYQDTYVVRKQ